MGKLFDDIKGSQSPRGNRPAILDVFTSLSQEEREDLLKALNDKSISSGSISRALAKRDIKLPAQSIARYRRGEFGVDLSDLV